MGTEIGTPAYQEEPRVEIIDGEELPLPLPSTNHEFVTGNIYHLFKTYLKGKPGKVFPGGAAVYLGNGEEYQPDVKVVCDRFKIRRDGIHGAPDLVVEVLSPCTVRYDRGHKMRVYARSGVREYWLVDPVCRTIEQYVPKKERFVLRDLYTQFEEADLKKMSERQRADVVTEFSCSLFEDLRISVEDVFADVENW